MTRIYINGNPVDAPDGATVLQAARSAGVDIPTLCHLDGEPASTSCFVCVVEVEGRGRLLPSCGLPVEEGMRVITDSARLREARREAIELLLSDHIGDCEAPCRSACPAGLPVPEVISLVEQGEMERAGSMLMEVTPLALALETACPRLCERACRRAMGDGAVAIRDLCRFALARASAPVRRTGLAPGKRAAVVGAGPCGLAAAFDLLRAGHACDVYDASAEAGGALRAGAVVPPDVFAAAVNGVLAMGGEFHFGRRLGHNLDLAVLRASHDAVLLALGAWRGGETPGAGRAVDLDLLRGIGLDTTGKGALVDRSTWASSVEGVFAAGEVVSGAGHAARAVGAGRNAAASMNRWLRQGGLSAEAKKVNVLMGKLSPDETAALLGKGSPAERTAGEGDGCVTLTIDGARREAGRCLRCDCGKKDACALRELATRFGARPRRFEGARRRYVIEATHEDVLYEPGKCVSCGRCSAISARMGERYGLSFTGRGFPVRVEGALSRPIRDALTLAARRCVKVCPTGALSFRHGRPSNP